MRATKEAGGRCRVEDPYIGRRSWIAVDPCGPKRWVDPDPVVAKQRSKRARAPS